MFERRLRVLLLLPILAWSVVVVRLYQLQIARGETYREKAEAALISPKRFLPPLRGRILDRERRPLVSDEPAYDVVVHYGVLVMDPAYLSLAARELGRIEPRWHSATPDARLAEIVNRVARMWTTLEQVSPKSMSELKARREGICQAVEALRNYIWNARRVQGIEEDFDKVRLAEEDMFHAVLRDLDPDERTRIDLELGNLPFVRIEPSVRRQRQKGSEAFCHLLGQLGQVNSQMIRGDAHRDDWLACYQAGEDAGVSGVERLAEDLLRGRRGYVEHSLDGDVLDKQPPVDGLDVRLSIDEKLQQHILTILTRTVHHTPFSTGAACVVLDVRTREILAMVSAPGFDWRTYREQFTALRDNVRDRPLLFRAIQNEYPPGSTIKPVALLAALSQHVIEPDTTISCDGSLVPGAKNWHCWTYWRGMPGHGPMTAVEAIQHSCNVYFYQIGQRVTAPHLTEFYRQFIRPSYSPEHHGGAGLGAEHFGIIPTENWIRKHMNREYRTADARNYAIGQGEVQLTPLQVANMFATLAAGYYRDPTLLADDTRNRPRYVLSGVTDRDWTLVREGLRRCVNDPAGTAYKYAKMDDLVVCGKTGSAQSVPCVLSWRYTFEPQNPGEPPPMIAAPTPEAARERLGLPANARIIEKKILETYPPKDPEKKDYPTHAWFAGFAPHDAPRIALAVIVEFGGGGGPVAGTVAKEVFETILDGDYGLRRSGPAPAVADRTKP